MSEPSASMLNNATIEKAERNEISNCTRDMFKFVQNNYNLNNMEELPDPIRHLINVVPHFLAEVRKNDHSGSTVSETTGADDSDETASTYHTPRSSILELVDISDMVPANPSSLPVTSIADRYTRSMLKCLAGYPLYSPKPLSELSKEYLRNGVNVGDVGFVRGNGTFDFLFNICPPQNDLINPPKLPDSFSLGTLDHSATTDLDPLPPKTCLFHSPITKTNSGAYTCEGSEGAVLELPEGAIQEEAINMLPFENLATRHGVEWYKYTMSRGRAISNGSLYLITSFTRCAQWGIAVFDRPCASGQGLKFDSETSFPFSFWNSTTKYCWKGLNTSNTKVANPNQGNAPNQCVFLRGYKIMVRQDIFDDLRKDQLHGSYTSMPSSSPQTGSSSSTFTRQKASRIRGGGGTDPSLRKLTGGSPLTKTMKSAVVESDEVVLHPNFNSSLIHPSDLVNVALLSQNPDAKVVLTHDDVWCDLLQENFPKINYATLIKIARSYGTSTVDEYGCVSLTKVSDSSNILNESSCPVGGAEVPALQVPIQGANEEHNPDISIPTQASTTPQPGAGYEGTPGISVPLQAPELPRLGDRDLHQRRREKKGKMNLSTATPLEVLDRQESQIPYKYRTNPRGPTSEMAAAFQRVREFTISGHPSVKGSTVNQQTNLIKRLHEEDRKLKDKWKESEGKRKEEVRKWEEERLTEDEADVKELKAGNREQEILRREAEVKQMDSEARRKELAEEGEARRMKEEAHRWEEEKEKKEKEIEREEEALDLAEETRQKADEIKNFPSNYAMSTMRTGRPIAPAMTDRSHTSDPTPYQRKDSASSVSSTSSIGRRQRTNSSIIAQPLGLSGTPPRDYEILGGPGVTGFGDREGRKSSGRSSASSRSPSRHPSEERTMKLSINTSLTWRSTGSTNSGPPSPSPSTKRSNTVQAHHHSATEARLPKPPARSNTTPVLDRKQLEGHAIDRSGDRKDKGERSRKVRICVKCDNKIEDGRWVQCDNGTVLCDLCWKSMYLPRCRRCNKTIEKQAVSSSDGQLKGKYHRECFNCHVCHKPFPDKTFYAFDSKPLCAYHYHQANKSLCSAPKCGQPIEGPCAVSHTGERYHPEHFTCEYPCHPRCSERLVEYWEIDRRMLCERHAPAAGRREQSKAAFTTTAEPKLQMR